MIRHFVSLLTIIVCGGCVPIAPIVLSVVSLGQPPAQVAARDLGISTIHNGEIAMFYGDTLTWSGQVFVNSWTKGSPLNPVTITANGLPAEVLPLSITETAYNSTPGHSDRWMRQVAGAIPNSNGSTTLYTILIKGDQTLGGFYTSFPVQKLGKVILGQSALQAAAPSGYDWEVSLPTGVIPTGFHLDNGETRFWLQKVSDSNYNSEFVPAKIVSNGYKVWNGQSWVSSENGVAAFTIDAIWGVSAVWNPRYKTFLISYIDSMGRLMLRNIRVNTGMVSSPTFVVQLPQWVGPWDGYGGYQVVGMQNANGTEVHLIYSKLNWIFANINEMFKVTLQ